MLTAAQQAVVKADILANSDLNVFSNNSDGAFGIAELYNMQATPDFWVWRTNIAQEEIVGTQSPTGTDWSWTDYVSRSAGERDGWREMFSNTGAINASRANVRLGSGLFTGIAGRNDRGVFVPTEI